MKEVEISAAPRPYLRLRLIAYKQGERRACDDGYELLVSACVEHDVERIDMR